MTVPRLALVTGAAQGIGRAVAARLAPAQDVAEAVAFLCSDDAAFITGTVLDVHGGSAMV